MGGVQTLLELISVKQAKEADKTEAINVLYSIADSGRKYKEHICECYGIMQRFYISWIACAVFEFHCDLFVLYLFFLFGAFVMRFLNILTYNFFCISLILCYLRGHPPVIGLPVSR